MPRAVFKLLWDTIQAGSEVFAYVKNMSKTGKYYWVQSTIVPILNKETRKPEQYASIRTEITHQKKLQENLNYLFLDSMLASEAKSSFMTSISHELRAPLNHIIGFSEVLEMNREGPEFLENIGYIKRAGHALLDKTSNILESADHDVHLKTEPEMINIVKLVNTGFIDFFKKLALRSKRKFTRTIPDQTICIVASKMNLLTAFRKIAENAIQFSTEGDIVGMSISATGDTVSIAIFDTGPGLPAHILSSRFEPFTIGEQVTAKANSGMGLGLPIARKLCVQNGGSFELEANKDIGTKIYFRFPIVAKN